jgi:hypothetical protein
MHHLAKKKKKILLALMFLQYHFLSPICIYTKLKIAAVLPHHSPLFFMA